jgi:H+/Cl- antiporter ClcA
MQKIFVGLSLLIVGIFTIATSSIAMECYNKHNDFKTEKKHNFNFIIATLVMGILGILSGSMIFASR